MTISKEQALIALDTIVERVPAELSAQVHDVQDYIKRQAARIAELEALHDRMDAEIRQQDQALFRLEQSSGKDAHGNFQQVTGYDHSIPTRVSSSDDEQANAAQSKPVAEVVACYDDKGRDDLRADLFDLRGVRAGDHLYTHPAPAQQPSEDQKRLVRELDVLLNGEDGAAQQASLCDIVAQVQQQGLRVGAQGEPVGYAPPNWTLGMPVTIMATRRPGYPVPVYLHPQDHGHGVVYQILAIDGCWEDVSKERFERESLVNHKRILYTAPAQQPVSGADELQRLADQVVLANATSNPDLHHDAVAKLIAGVRNLRQQQPAVVAQGGEEIMVNAAHDVYTLPLKPSGLTSGPRFVVHVPAPEQPAVPEGWRQALQACAEHLGMLGHAGCPAAVNARALLSAQQPSSRVVGREVSTEVCPECDIAGCKHIRERQANAASAASDLTRDAERYRFLRSADINAIHEGGIFVGVTPENVVINGDDLDRAVDAARKAQAADGEGQ